MAELISGGITLLSAVILIAALSLFAVDQLAKLLRRDDCRHVWRKVTEHGIRRKCDRCGEWRWEQ